MAETTQSLHRALQLEQARRAIREADPEQLRALTERLLEGFVDYQQTAMRAAWKLGELERENGDLRRKLVELQAG